MRPMVLSAPMVTAVLRGLKTQVRRELKPQLGSDIPPNPCPFGGPGDLIWVRENFAVLPDGRVAYAADRAHPLQTWNTATQMGQWASRLTLEITAVRVERLQAISEADAKAEGYANRSHFAKAWDANTGRLKWYQNPAVWVVEFRRVDAPERVPAVPSARR